MRKSDAYPSGTIDRLTVHSTALRGNPLSDSPVREVRVYLPAGHSGAGLPLLVDLAGFTGSGLAHVNWKGFAENLPERLDRLIGSRAMAPAAVAMPDGFTRLGGNQYVNSPAIGRWEDFLIDEMVPAIEDRYRCGGPGRRGVFGKSSGGYGAIVHVMRHPDTWSAVACHSGDMGFELCYLADMPETLRVLADHDHSIQTFLGAMADGEPDSREIHCLMMLAMAASYDPGPDGEIRLPVDLQTCELIEERWARWLSWDPVRMVGTHAQALRTLRLLYFDCGTEDEYNLLYGARRLQRSLERLGVAHRFEEFPGRHSGIDHRMDVSLPLLADALGPAEAPAVVKEG